MKRQDERAGAQEQAVTVALVGNPNVGKSTLFNTLTGCRRHTGNWAGKTLDCATGQCRYARRLHLVDLPGMYAWHEGEQVLPEEAEAIAYLESGRSDAVVIVCDAGALERNLVLVLQLLQRVTLPVAVVINLCAEAAAHGVRVNAATLENCLGVPVWCVEAWDRGAVAALCPRLQALPQLGRSTELPSLTSAEIAARACEDGWEQGLQGRARRWERVMDRLLMGRWSSYVSMAVLLAVLLWVTLVGANVLSDGLAWLLSGAEWCLWRLLAPVPPPLADFLVGGVARTVFWVVSVMLPPMAIFFPLFGALEDLGVLPRLAFALDHPLGRCHACGKQALTMCMGLGCNSVGVTGCRIIDSPRERSVAIVTNVLIPCNGRLPTLSVLILLFFGAGSGIAASLRGALWMLGFLLLGVAMTLLCSTLLSRTLLRGERSACLLELPPYRLPRPGALLFRSVVDRTLKILLRAVAVSVPAGALLWLLTHIEQHGVTAADGLVALLEAPAALLGLDGVILAAAWLSFPANELFLPVIMMLYGGKGCMEPIGGYEVLSEVLLAAGWDVPRALCVAVFVLFHWPCATTLWTIRKEGRSLPLTLLAFLLPTLCGVGLCALICLASKVYAWL